MVAVTDQQSWWIVTGIERLSVRRVELLEVVSLTSEMLQVFAILVKFENVVTGIPVRQENISVWSNRRQYEKEELKVALYVNIWYATVTL